MYGAGTLTWAGTVDTAYYITSNNRHSKQEKKKPELSQLLYLEWGYGTWRMRREATDRPAHYTHSLLASLNGRVVKLQAFST